MSKQLKVFWVDCPKVGGSVQCGKRPCIKLRECNEYMTIIPMTSHLEQADKFPSCKRVSLTIGDGVAKCDQILTIPKSAVGEMICKLSQDDSNEVLATALKLFFL